MSASPIAWLALEGIKGTDGQPLAGGKLFFFYPETTTQMPVYSDAAKTAILSQPITLDAYGRYDTVFTDGPSKILAQTSAGATVDTLDSFNAKKDSEIMVESAAFTGTLTNGTSAASGKVALTTVLSRAKESFGGVDWKYLAETGATERTIQAVLRERGLSVKDRGAKGDGSTVDTAAFTSAISSLQAAGGGVLFIPPGTYQIDAALSVQFAGLHVVGLGSGVSILNFTNTSADGFTLGNYGSMGMRGIKIAHNSTLSTASGIDSQSSNLYLDDVTIIGYQNAIELRGSAQRTFMNNVHMTVSYDAATHPTAIGILFDGSTSNVRVANSFFSHATAGQGYGAHVPSGSAANEVLITGCQFGSLLKGIVVNSGATTSSLNWGLYHNYFAACTTAIDIGVTHAFYLHQEGNYYGAKLFLDASALPTLASATDLYVPGPGTYLISGATQIDYIKTCPVGTAVRFIFSSNPVVNYNTGAGDTTKRPILLAGAADYTTSANDTLDLVFKGDAWVETARTVI